MKKQLCMGILLLTLSSLALGSEKQNSSPPGQNNFLTKPSNIQYYSGLYFGVGIGVNSNTWRDKNDIDNHATNGDLAFNSSLSVGYGKAFTIESLNSSFYLGGELSGQYSPFQSTAFSYQRFLLVPAVKLGYFLTPKTMLYALGGLKKYMHDLNPMGGIGIETMVSKKISLSGQFTYTNYHNNSDHQKWQGGVLLGAAYHFNGI